MKPDKLARKNQRAERLTKIKGANDPKPQETEKKKGHQKKRNRSDNKKKETPPPITCQGLAECLRVGCITQTAGTGHDIKPSANFKCRNGRGKEDGNGPASASRPRGKNPAGNLCLIDRN